jgi:RNA exonuclease 4
LEQIVALDAEFVEGAAAAGGGAVPTAAAAASGSNAEEGVDLLARLSIVDGHGRVLYDEFVRPGQPVVDYRTPISGVTEAQLVEKGAHFLLLYHRKAI